MAILTKKEFAENCGLKTKALSVYIKRLKVIATEEGMIDDANEFNQAFAMHQKELSMSRSAGKKARGVKEKKKKVKIKKEKTVKPPPEPKPTDPTLLAQARDKMDLDKKKRHAEIEKMKHESNLLQMRQDKLQGKLMPTDQVNTLFAQHFKSIVTSFRDAVEQIALEFGKKMRMNRNESAEMKKVMIAAINRATDNAIHMSKKDLRNMANEISQD